MIGPIKDYSKLLKLVINGGAVNKCVKCCKTKIQILKPQTIEYIFGSKIKSTQGIFSFGMGTLNLLNDNETWAGGFTNITNNNGLILPFAVGANFHRWGSYYGQTYYFDTKTGNYLIGGTQVSAASWALPGSTAQFQPDIAKIWQILTTSN